MKVRTIILGAVSALALSAVTVPAALAGANFSGNVSANYGHVDGSGSDANLWGLSGSGVFNVGSNWNIGFDAGYSNFDASGFNADAWGFDGNVFYRFDKGRLGAVVGYTSADAGFGTFHVTNYGGAADWFANDKFTVSAKGGGFSGSSSADGYYLGGALTAYAMPDLAFTGSYDYTHFTGGFHESDWTIKGEWLVSETTPISISGGYTGTDFSGLGTVNTWFLGVTFYTNGDGSATLVDRQRNGTFGYGSTFSPLALKVL